MEGGASVLGSRLWCLWINSSYTRNEQLWATFGVELVRRPVVKSGSLDRVLLVSTRRFLFARVQYRKHLDASWHKRDPEVA